MISVNIQPDNLKRLQERASREQCSIDELLTRLLGNPLAEDEEETAESPALIDERRRAADALRDNDGRFAAFIRHAFEGISRTEFDEPIDIALPIETQIDQIYERAYLAECNQAMVKMYGWTSIEDTVGIRMIDVHGGKDNPVNRATFRQFIENGYRSADDVTVEYRADGELIWVLNNTVGIVENGFLVQLWGTSIDITKRQKAEEALRESEERYRLLAQNVTDMISRHTLEGVYTYLTPSVSRLLGYTPEELVGHSAYELFHPDDWLAIRHSHQTILEQPLVNTIEYRIQRKDGQYLWVETTTHVVRDPVTHKPIEIIAVTRDASERKQVQEALRESEGRYRVVSELVSDYAYSYQIHADGQISLEWITDAYTRVTGYMPYVVNEPGPYMLYHPDDREQVKADVARVVSGEEVTSECRIYTKSGELRWLRVYRRPVWDTQAGRVVRFYAVVQDITIRKQAEEALRKSEERYRVVSKLVSDYAYSFQVEADGQMLLEWITESVEQVTGYRSDDPDSPPSYGLYHPDDKDKAHQDVARVIQGEEVTSEYRILTKTGDVRWLRTIRHPIWDAQAGRVIRFYAVVKDITLEKQAEQIRLEQERLKATLKKEKEFNALIQQAVSALSHDIRTPLAVIATTKESLARYFDRLDENRRREKLDSIGRQLRYVVELLDDVTMTVKGSLDHSVFAPQTVNLAALCQASVNEIQETAGINHRLRFVTDGQITTAIVDETLVSRILLNLLLNAVKFSPAMSEIRLELSRRDDRILLRVVDHGIGITEADQVHIFEPFFRADAVRAINGTGLGLSIVQDCVTRHQGCILVTSQVGQGTTFTVELPLTQS